MGRSIADRCKGLLTYTCPGSTVYCQHPLLLDHRFKFGVGYPESIPFFRDVEVDDLNDPPTFGGGCQFMLAPRGCATPLVVEAGPVGCFTEHFRSAARHSALSTGALPRGRLARKLAYLGWWCSTRSSGRPIRYVFTSARSMLRCRPPLLSRRCRSLHIRSVFFFLGWGGRWVNLINGRD